MIDQKLKRNESMRFLLKIRGSKRRLVLLLLNCLVNIALCFVFAGTGTDAPAASNHLLIIFFFNLFTYYCYYIIMKRLSNESLHVAPVIYMTCCVVCLGTAMYFFVLVKT